MKRTLNYKKLKRVLLLFGGTSFLIICIILITSGKKLLRLEENISFGSYELSVRDYGKGSPTVIIEAGLNCSKHLYYKLQYRTSRHARVIAYDHAGIGESTPSPNPRTLPYYVEELKALLEYKKIEPPYILIGHSLGGHIIRYFTYLYPDEVAGLIFIDHPHEDWFRYIRNNWDKDDIENYFKFWDPEITSYKGVGLIELTEYEANCDSIRGKEIPPDIPVLMFTGNNTGHFRKDGAGKAKDQQAWAEMQESLISNVKNAKHIIDWEAGHMVHIDKPDMVQAEVDKFIADCKKNIKNK